jgi:hypothetical protein
MFADLLRALADDRPRTMGELAGELGVDAAMLRRAFEHCERAGYLVREGAGFSLGCCGSCGAGSCGSGSCAAAPGGGPSSGAARPPSSGPSWWRVTQSGRRAARLDVRPRPLPSTQEDVASTV